MQTGTPRVRATTAAPTPGYFARGGLQAQFSVIDTSAMREARKHPERFADLLVRIGGYSEYFTRLDPELQQTVIDRSEHE